MHCVCILPPSAQETSQETAQEPSLLSVESGGEEDGLELGLAEGEQQQQRAARPSKPAAPVLTEAMLEKEVTRRRNFAIISHPDAGKTTLVGAGRAGPRSPMYVQGGT